MKLLFKTQKIKQSIIVNRLQKVDTIFKNLRSVFQNFEKS